MTLVQSNAVVTDLRRGGTDTWASDAADSVWTGQVRAYVQEKRDRQVPTTSSQSTDSADVLVIRSVLVDGDAIPDAAEGDLLVGAWDRSGEPIEGRITTVERRRLAPIAPHLATTRFTLEIA